MINKILLFILNKILCDTYCVMFSGKRIFYKGFFQKQSSSLSYFLSQLYTTTSLSLSAYTQFLQEISNELDTIRVIYKFLIIVFLLFSINIY